MVREWPEEGANENGVRERGWVGMAVGGGEGRGGQKIKDSPLVIRHDNIKAIEARARQ